MAGRVRLGRFPMLDFGLKQFDHPRVFWVWGALLLREQIGERLFHRTELFGFNHYNNSGSRGAIFHRAPGPCPIFSAIPRRVRSYSTFVKRLIMSRLVALSGAGMA